MTWSTISRRSPVSPASSSATRPDASRALTTVAPRWMGNRVSTRWRSHHAPSAGRWLLTNRVRHMAGTRCIAPGKWVSALAFNPRPSPEMGQRRRCQRLGLSEARSCQKIEFFRTRSCGCAPASRSRAAASRADWPAPITATSHPLNAAKLVILEVWAARAGGRDASTGGT